jgi:hypothetical protein
VIRVSTLARVLRGQRINMDVTRGRFHGYIQRIRRRPIYIALSVLIAALAVAGFSPSVVGKALRHQIPHDAIIHVHVAIYAIWLVLFFAQTVLAAIGRMKLHRKLGKVLMAYGVLMALAGWGVTLNRFLHQVRSGHPDLAQSENLAPTIDMLVFPIFFGLAIYHVRKPELHKRLMIVTATLLVYPAVVRIPLSKPFNTTWVLLGVWTSPVLIAMAHDWVKRRLVHPAYVAGALSMTLLVLRYRLTSTAIWAGICRWVILHVAHNGTPAGS